MNKNKKLLLVMAASTVGNLAFSSNNVYANNINQEESYRNSKLATNLNISNKNKGKVINVHTNLRIRKEPNTNCTILGHLKNGEEFKITGKNGKWYSMEYKGIKGYVHGDYVKDNITSSTKISENIIGNREEINTTNKRGYVVNIVTNLRVRQNPSTNSGILGYLRNGQEVNIKEKIGKWYSIEVNDKLGYVYGDYIKEGEKINNKNVKSLSENKTSINNNISRHSGKVINVNIALRIRKSPSINSDILGYLKKGDTFKINSKIGQWYNVTVGEKDGYIHHSYVQLSSNNSLSSNNKEVKDNNREVKINNSKEVKKDNLNKNVQNKSETINLNYSKRSEELTENKLGTVHNVSTNLSLRSGTSTDSKTLAYLLPGEGFKIIAKSGEWYRIDYKGKVGYVHNNYVKIVDSSSNIEKKSDNKINENNKTKNEIKNTNKVGQNKNIENIVKENSNNKKGTNQNKKRENLNKQNTTKTETNKNTVNSSNKENNSSFNKVYNMMKLQLGSPYIYGGSGEQITQSLLNSFKGTFSSHASRGFYDIDSKYINRGYKAFDCSGLIQWAFNQVGVNLGRSTYDQINAGVEVSKSNVKPGDLLFYKDLGHVGMYIGNGKWIESPNKGKNVREASVPWPNIGKIRRVL